jgi:hypothetical protein
VGEFDYQATVRKIIALYRERGLERTETDVLKYAKALMQRHGISTRKALDVIEDDLLSSPPPKLPNSSKEQ